MAFVPEGHGDRSQARSAWGSVPRKSRPVGYGMNGAQLIPEVFLDSNRLAIRIYHPAVRVTFTLDTNHTVPYGTALWGGAVPGTSCLATIAPSLRDI
jgi:hypothetical protein